MARLPTPGGDSGNWGDILNEYLSQSLKPNGNLKDNSVTGSALAPNSVTNAALASNAVNATIIQDGSVTEALLDNSLKAKLNATAPVTSVSGKTGAVSLTKSDVELSDVDNTSDADKPVSSAQLTAIQTRVLKQAGSTRVYIKNVDGNDTAVPYSSSATALTMMWRTDGGVTSVGEPTSSTHAATKNYVDTQTTNLVSLTSTQTITGNKQFNGTLTIAGAGGNALRLQTGAATGGLSLGADLNATTRSTDVRKVGVISAPNFANTANIEILSSNSYDVTNNDINFGGRLAGTNTAATAINFITAPDTTTTGGTIRMNIDRNGFVGIGTASPTHSLTLPSTSTGVAMYGTADQTTNYQRFRAHWSGPTTYSIATERGGTGVDSNLRVIGGASLMELGVINSAFATQIRRDNTGLSLVNVTSTGLTSSNAIQAGITIDPTVSQAGTSGYSMLRINPTETATGSGAKLLIDAQVGSVSRFTVYNTGETKSGNLQVKQTSGGSLTRGIAFTGTGINGPNDGTGYLFTLGYNTPGNKQIWFGDPDYMGDSTKTFVRMNNLGVLDAISGNNVNRKRLTIGVDNDDLSGATLGGNIIALYSASGHTSGIVTPFKITPTFNDSGTAGYTAMDIHVTETATGSGGKLLINAQVGGASKFSVSNVGKVALGTAVQSGTALVRIGDDTVTNAGGLQFGSDTYLFRNSINGLSLSGGLSIGSDLGIGGAFFPGALTRVSTLAIGIHDKMVNYANASSGAITLTLPNTVSPGVIFTFKKVDSTTNTVTIAGIIDGATNYNLTTQYSWITVSSTATSGAWYIIGKG